MKKIFIISLVLFTALLLGYRNDNHKHVWTTIMQDTVVVKFAPINYNALNWELQQRRGFEVGPELICIKCFKKINQVINYGDETVDPPITK